MKGFEDLVDLVVMPVESLNRLTSELLQPLLKLRVGT